MIIGTISDLHGKDYWKKFIKDNPHIEKWVFQGDYLDSFTHLNIELKDNLSDIIDFKRKYPEKVELLLGNHDIPFFYDDAPMCSGHRENMKIQLRADLINENKDLFKIAYQYKNYLWTHAGISNKWYTHYEKYLGDHADKCSSMADILNMLSETTEGRDKLFSIGEIRGGYDVGGPLWADYYETSADFLECEEHPLHQIVGHSKVPDIVTFNNEGGSITFCDVFDTVRKFYTLNIE